MCMNSAYFMACPEKKIGLVYKYCGKILMTNVTLDRNFEMLY